MSTIECPTHPEELPESLDDTYERIVIEIKEANRAYTYHMLQCLAVAIRPPSVAELAKLLSFEFDASNGGIQNGHGLDVGGHYSQYA